jgi:hypothetical protein
MTPTDDRAPEGGLVQRVEVLLSSLTAVVSARVVLDEEKGAQVHIIATSEMPVSEVSRAVMSALTWGLGFEVPPNQITVVQSRLSREELKALLGSEKADLDPSLTAPEDSPPEVSAPEDSAPEDSAPEKAAPDPPEPKPAVPDTGLLEFSLGGTSGEPKGGSEVEFRRLELQDLQMEKRPQGGFGISVRLADNDRSIGAQREAAGTEEDCLEVPADAALGVIQEFLRAGREDGLSVVLRFMAARRLRSPQHDVVVVLVEAIVRGRRIPLTGARRRKGLDPGHASSDQRVRRRYADSQRRQRVR